MLHWEKSNCPLTDLCIVLDIDETLVHTFEGEDVLEKLGINHDPKLIPIKNRTYHFGIDDATSKKGKGEITEIAGILRPGLEAFLAFCFCYFKCVIVWSAGQPRYVQAMVNRLFRDLEDPYIVFTQKACEKNKNGFLIKPLEKLMEEDVNKFMRPENTFVLDDRKWTFEKNPDNAILIPGYEPHLHDSEESPTYTIKLLSEDENSLRELQAWLETPEVMKCKDVRRLDKSHIFSRK